MRLAARRRYESTMIAGVLDLQDTKVSEVMQPRVEVKALEVNDSMLDLLALVNTTRYSRIPVRCAQRRLALLWKGDSF